MDSRTALDRTSDSLHSPGRATGKSVDAPLLSARGVTVAFPARDGMVIAANDVSFGVRAGRTLGLVGESGCGKSVTLRSLLGLVPYPGEVIAGEVMFDGRDLLNLSGKDLETIRGREISMIFQDPTSSLNPVLSVGDQLSETLRTKLHLGKRDAAIRSIELLERVGIPSPKQRVRDFPHQLSGGMKQRVMIAIAIASQPRLLLADEPTTALDVTIQDQILALLADLQDETGMGLVLVSHDLGVIGRSSDDISVMYAGYIVERGTAAQVLREPRHPYTQGLLGAIPPLRNGGRRGALTAIPGQPPNIAELPQGCPFIPRCPHALETCAQVDMQLEPPIGHGSACPVIARKG